MTSEVFAEVPPLAVFLRPELDGDALLGLPGEIAARCAEATGADVAACLLSVLVMLGSAVGAEPHAATPDGAGHSARLYGVLVGETGVSRKGTAVNAVRRLFANADPRWESGRVTGGLKSPEKMIEKVDDHGDDTRLMLIEPEFARLLGVLTKTGFGPNLRKAWDGERLENETRDPKNNLRAPKAHISLLGSITPAELERFHGRLAQEGGMENRLLFALAAPWPPAQWFDLEEPDYGDLIDRLRATIELSRAAVLEKTDPLSRAIFIERGAGFQPSTVLPLHDKVRAGWKALVKDRLVRAGSDEMAPLWARAEAQVLRVAVAYAIGCAADMVGVEHVTAAVALVNYCLRTVEVLFGVAAVQGAGRENRNQARKVLDYLRKKQSWVTRTEISRQVFQGNVPAAAISALMRSLVARGHVEMGRIRNTGGGPRTEYRITPPRPAIRKD